MKQVIVVNESLGLPCGKLAAQVAHAAIGAFLQAKYSVRAEWLATGMTKVVLACASTEALLALQEQAAAAALPQFLVADAGRTVVAAGTVTCLGIGPAADEAISAVTGTLKLLA
jgi:peptidyl-tRNA hydrolase, PTH2 family